LKRSIVVTITWITIKKPRQHRSRSHHNYTKKNKVELFLFNDRENDEEYLDWEMKVEQIFECHQVDQERRVSLDTLSFHGPAICIGGPH